LHFILKTRSQPDSRVPKETERERERERERQLACDSHQEPLGLQEPLAESPALQGLGALLRALFVLLIKHTMPASLQVQFGEKMSYKSQGEFFQMCAGAPDLSDRFLVHKKKGRY
jgi:hypothetical protein